MHLRWPAIKIIVVSGQLKLPDLDLPPLSRFLGKPLDAGEVIAEMRDMIGHAEPSAVFIPNTVQIA